MPIIINGDIVNSFLTAKGYSYWSLPTGVIWRRSQRPSMVSPDGTRPALVEDRPYTAVNVDLTHKNVSAIGRRPTARTDCDSTEPLRYATRSAGIACRSTRGRP